MDISGRAEDIYIRSSLLAAKMIKEIIEETPTPVPQKGTPFIFARRTPEQSLIPDGISMEKMYDFIRMLDAQGYPKAYFDRGGFRFEFSFADMEKGKIEAKVKITKSKLS